MHRFKRWDEILTISDKQEFTQRDRESGKSIRPNQIYNYNGMLPN